MHGSQKIWSSSSLDTTWENKRERFYPTPLGDMYNDAPWCVVRQVLVPSLFITACWDAFLEYPMRTQRNEYLSAAMDRVLDQCRLVRVDDRVGERRLRIALTPSVISIHTTLTEVYRRLREVGVQTDEACISVEGEFICMDYQCFVDSVTDSQSFINAIANLRDDAKWAG